MLRLSVGNGCTRLIDPHARRLDLVACSNLILNAVRYTPAGGTITVQLKRTASGARLAISDTGCGISEQHIPRLTERFYRVDVGRSRETGGTGLGLSIVKHIVQSLGGKVWVESVPGRGATFHFTIPRATAGLQQPLL